MTGLLLFLSGFAALVYQVLWMRDLAVLFGSSAHAAAVDLAVFFGGIAAGAALYGRLARRVSNPLRVYGILELAVAASALMFFVLLDVYAWIYAPLYQRVGDKVAILILVKSMLAVGILALPTMCMGATLPAMVQHAGGRGAWWYGINTAGATLGAFSAGFYLPPTLGFRGSYLLAVTLNVAAGLLALYAARTALPAPAADVRPAPSRRRQSSGAEIAALPGRVGPMLAVASGALTIALEIAWLRMFAQVLDNSVYAFSAIIVVALAAFALAALVVDRLGHRSHEAGWMAVALAACAALMALQPRIFIALTGDLAPVQGDSWPAYVTRIFGMSALFVGVPAFVAGLVFPSLLRSARAAASAGATVGRLVALNTGGAIGGSLITTFVLLPSFGLWVTFALIALVYAGLAAKIGWLREARARRSLVFAAAAAAAVISLASPTLPRVRLDAARGERVLGVWEGSHGTVAVTEAAGGRALRLNNSYSLGGTVDRIERERIQTLIPLMLHRDPRQVFFLGLGTGITAGEAVRHAVERVVVCELVPEVVQASRQYFHEWTRGLGVDPRVEIRQEDGRQYLAASGETFDVIVSDLFVPWHAGTGMLYTREHFETVRARLRPGGLFAQWLPLFQLNQRDFEVLARTILEVFPHTVIWRGDFYANRPIVALVASDRPMPIDAGQLVTRARALAPEISDASALAGILPFYAGNLGQGRGILDEGPINTDEYPVIEYLSPTTQWGSGAGGTPWFVSMSLVRFFERLRAAVPLDRDPYLAPLTPAQRAYVEAGAYYHRAIVERLAGDDTQAERDLGESLQRLPADVQVAGPFMALDPLLR